MIGGFRCLEMQAAADRLAFEEAAVLRDRMNKLKLLESGG